MNKVLLRKIQTRLLAKPEKFNMSAWANEGERASQCGTTCCIGGWALIYSKYKVQPVKDDYGQICDVNFVKGTKIVDAETAAAKELRLTVGEGTKLFHVENWPEDLRTSYWTADTTKERAYLAAARIERFIQTGD